MDLAAGSVAGERGGRYELLECVGEGGTARVYRGLAADGRAVAIKVLTWGGDPSALARFRREVEIATLLRHPNLVALVDHGIDPGLGPFLVMPFLEGVTARALFYGHSRRLSPEATLLVLCQVLEALEAMHAAALVHRDLKPENLIVGPTGDVTIVDLGLALGQDHSRLTAEGHVAGSIPYMSPEQIEDRPVSPASDLWAVAVMAYEWIAGARPFARARPGEEVAAILSGTHEPLAAIDRRASPDLSAALERCLDRDPRARPARAGELLAWCRTQLDWVSPDQLPAERRALVTDLGAFEARVAALRSRELREAARGLVAAGDSFVALRVLDRALAYAPDDPEALRLVEEAAGAGVATTALAERPRLVETGSAADRARPQPTAIPHPAPVRPAATSWQTGLLIAAAVIVALASSIAIAFAASCVGCALACADCRPTPAETPAVTAPRPWPPPPSTGELAGSLPASQIAVGPWHACAVLEQGLVACWGSNDHGQLGTGDVTTSARPARAVGLAGIVQVTAGEQHSCALAADGAVWCWGEGNMGQLGTGLRSASPVPAPVPGLPPARSIAAGGFHTCAVIDDGTVMCWGRSLYGEAGPADGMMQPTPRRIEGLPAAAAVGGGQEHSCALGRDGTVWCWGGNSEGRLGSGARFASSHPVAVAGLADAVALAVSEGHSCALTRAGQARCWGDGRQGQLGASQSSRVPRSMPVAGVTQLALGANATCMVIADGTARCWGSNEHNALALGSAASVAEPTPLPVGAGIRQLALGRAYTCLLDAAPQARCWGELGMTLPGGQPLVVTPAPTPVAFLTRAALPPPPPAPDAAPPTTSSSPSSGPASP